VDEWPDQIFLANSFCLQTERWCSLLLQQEMSSINI
jgi:hypothetical protein